MPLTITSDLAPVAERFAQASDAAPLLLRASMAQLGLDIRAEAESVVKAHTPVGNGPNNTDGSVHLRDTTAGDPILVTESSVSTAIRQTKRITIKGDSVPLWSVLTTGHGRPPDGIKPVNKQALFWPGIRGGHPVRFSAGGSAPPDPYIAEAATEMIPLLQAQAAATAQRFSTRVLQVIRP
jgi:hypothetical protein